MWRAILSRPSFWIELATILQQQLSPSHLPSTESAAAAAATPASLPPQAATAAPTPIAAAAAVAAGPFARNHRLRAGAAANTQRRPPRTLPPPLQSIQRLCIHQPWTSPNLLHLSDQPIQYTAARSRSGTRWVREQPPVGVGAGEYPDEPCWASSYELGVRQAWVDAAALGLRPPVVFEVLTEVATRFDCGGQYAVTFGRADLDADLIDLPAGTPWQRALAEPVFWTDPEPLQYTEKGKDDRFWSGNYGTKFRRSIVRLRPMNPSEMAVAMVDQEASTGAAARAAPARA